MSREQHAPRIIREYAPDPERMLRALGVLLNAPTPPHSDDAVCRLRQDADLTSIRADPPGDPPFTDSPVARPA